VEAETHCTEAIKHFQEVLTKVSCPDLEEGHSIQQIFRSFIIHYQSFLTQFKLRKLIFQIDNLISKSPLFEFPSENDEKVNIPSILIDFSILAIKIIEPNSESINAIRALRLYCFLLLFPDEPRDLPVRNFRELLEPLCRSKPWGDSHLFIDLIALFRTLPARSWHLCDRFSGWLAKRRKLGLGTSDFRSLFDLFSALIEIANEAGTSNHQLTIVIKDLLLVYSTPLIRSCLAEQLDIVQMLRTKSALRTEPNFLGDLQGFANATEEVVLSGLVDSSHKDFFSRFVIYLKLLISLFSIVPQPSFEKSKTKCLRCFPDIRRLEPGL
jgi:hypothetical protein